MKIRMSAHRALSAKADLSLPGRVGRRRARDNVTSGGESHIGDSQHFLLERSDRCRGLSGSGGGLQKSEAASAQLTGAVLPGIEVARAEPERLYNGKGD
jgi:hypothetical protein